LGGLRFLYFLDFCFVFFFLGFRSWFGVLSFPWPNKVKQYHGVQRGDDENAQSQCYFKDVQRSSTSIIVFLSSPCAAELDCLEELVHFLWHTFCDFEPNGAGDV